MSLHPTPHAKFLDANKILDVKQVEVYSKSSSFSHSAPVLTRFLARVFGHKEASIIIAGTDNEQGERRLLHKLIDDGFLTEYYEGPLFCDYPKLWSVATGLASSKDGKETVLNSLGTAFLDEPRELAYMRAIGEFVERRATYFFGGKKEEQRVGAKKRDLSHLYEFFPKFTKRQLEKFDNLMSSPDDLRNVLAVPARSLVRNATAYLPLSCVMWGAASYGPGEKVFVQATTNGNGGGATKEQAFLSAAYELIERDHFLLYWLSGIKPSVIDIGSIPGPFGEYIRKSAQDYHLEVFFLDLRYDTNVQVAACILVDPVLHFITMGAKASSSSLPTLKASFMEALSVLIARREKKEKNSEEELRMLLDDCQFDKHIDRKERMGMYSSPDGISLIRDFFLNGTRISYGDYSAGEATFPSDKEEMLSLVGRFKRLYDTKGEGYDLYVSYFSDELTRRFGSYVAHAFVPSFLKLHLTEHLAAPVSERLFAFAKERGKKLDEDSIVTLPHFFP